MARQGPKQKRERERIGKALIREREIYYEKTVQNKTSVRALHTD